MLRRGHTLHVVPLQTALMVCRVWCSCSYSPVCVRWTCGIRRSGHKSSIFHAAHMKCGCAGLYGGKKTKNIAISVSSETAITRITVCALRDSGLRALAAPATLRRLRLWSALSATSNEKRHTLASALPLVFALCLCALASGSVLAARLSSNSIRTIEIVHRAGSHKGHGHARPIRARARTRAGKRGGGRRAARAHGTLTQWFAPHFSPVRTRLPAWTAAGSIFPSGPWL